MKDDIAQLFPSSIFIDAQQQVSSRRLEFTVVGKLGEAEIINKAAEIAKD